MTDTSRRAFLKSAGTYSAVAGVGLSGGLSLGGPTAPRYAHPFGYPEAGLDVERTRELAYAGYKGLTLADDTRHGGCAFAGFNALIGQLAEVVGEPYTTIPTQMMDWAGAGVAGFGTLCGTLNGVAAAIGLVCDGADARGFVSDLMTWYSETTLPTNIIAPTGDLTRSTAESNLCHISVSRWCMESGLASGSPSGRNAVHASLVTSPRRRWRCSTTVAWASSYPARRPRAGVVTTWVRTSRPGSSPTVT